MDPDWVRDIRARCRKASVPFFFKQRCGASINPRTAVSWMVGYGTRCRTSSGLESRQATCDRAPTGRQDQHSMKTGVGLTASIVVSVTARRFLSAIHEDLEWAHANRTSCITRKYRGQRLGRRTTHRPSGGSDGFGGSGGTRSGRAVASQNGRRSSALDSGNATSSEGRRKRTI
jgi:hypothetical protein